MQLHVAIALGRAGWTGSRGNITSLPDQLTPYAREAESKTLDLLEAALSSP
jgi:hypothetical protein